MEVIAINDGSTDASKNILQNYQDNDSRVTGLHQENRGLSAVRNRGLKCAKGKYIYFFDSDDVLKPGALEKVITRLENTESEIACFSVNMIDEAGSLRTENNEKIEKGLEITLPVKGGDFLQKVFYAGKYGAIVQKYVFHRQFLYNHQLLFDEGYIHEDEAFMIESLCQAGKVVSFEEVLLLKRSRPGSIMSTQRSEKNVKGWVKAASRMLQFLENTSFSDATETVIKKKASQLILISLYNIQKINKRSSSILSLYDYIDRDELRKLGFTFYLKIKFNLLYKAYYKMKSFFA
jgi:glycosyltransferase involved in cell wall biosynthesis